MKMYAEDGIIFMRNPIDVISSVITGTAFRRFPFRFIGWIDGVTFEIGFNQDQSFTMQRAGKGEFLLGFD